MSTTKKAQLSQITEKIIKGYQPNKIILFGSYAWGKPTIGSDFDIFIIKSTKKRRIDRARDVQRLLWGTKMPVDVIVYTPQEVKKRLRLGDFFIEDILSKGTVIFSQTKK